MTLRAALRATTALVAAATLGVSPAAAQTAKPPGGAVFVVLPGASATAATVALQMPSGVPIPIGVLNPTTGLFAPSGLGAVQSGLASEIATARANEALLAPLASPAFSGLPTAPTAAPKTASGVLATTAYADAATAAEAAIARLAEQTNATSIAANATAIGNEVTRAKAAEALAFPAASAGGAALLNVGTIVGTVADGSVDPLARGAVQAAGGNGSAVNVTAAGGTVPLTLSYSFGRLPFAEAQGLVPDGTATGSAALSTIYANAAAGSTIDVGPGSINPSKFPAYASKDVLWNLHGTLKTDLSDLPCALPGLVHGFLVNREKICKVGQPDDGSMLEINRNASYSGGTAGKTSRGLYVYTNAGINTQTYEWNALFKLDNYSDSGHNVSIYGQGNLYNSGPKGGGSTFAAVFEAGDRTTNTTLASPLIGAEIDISPNGDDPNLVGVGLDVVVGRGNSNVTGTTPKPGWGIRVGGSGNAVYKAFTVRNITADYGFDTSLATIATAAFHSASNQLWAFDTAGTHGLIYNSSGSALQYKSGGATIFNFFDSGAITTAGTIQIGSSANQLLFSGAISGVGTVQAQGTATNIPVALLGKGTGGVRASFYTGTVAPTTTDIPAGVCADWSNSGDSSVKHYCNVGGTLKAITLN